MNTHTYIHIDSAKQSACLRQVSKLFIKMFSKVLHDWQLMQGNKLFPTDLLQSANWMDSRHKLRLPHFIHLIDEAGMSPEAIVDSNEWNPGPGLTKIHNDSTCWSTIPTTHPPPRTYQWQCRAVIIIWVESREWTKLGGMAVLCFRTLGGWVISLLNCELRLRCSWSSFNCDTHTHTHTHKEKQENFTGIIKFAKMALASYWQGAICLFWWIWLSDHKHPIASTKIRLGNLFITCLITDYRLSLIFPEIYHKEIMWLNSPVWT